MTRNSVYVCITVIFVVLMTSCGTKTSNENPKAGQIEQEYTELPFTNVALRDTPSAVQRWVEKNKSTERNKVFNVDGRTYIIILLGQRNTGGYNVEITQMGKRHLSKTAM